MGEDGHPKGSVVFDLAGLFVRLEVARGVGDQLTERDDPILVTDVAAFLRSFTGQDRQRLGEVLCEPRVRRGEHPLLDGDLQNQT